MSTKSEMRCAKQVMLVLRLSDVPAMTINGMIFEGDVLLARGDCDGARNVFGRALRLSQAIPEDSFELECRCMAKVRRSAARDQVLFDSFKFELSCMVWGVF